MSFNVISGSIEQGLVFAIMALGVYFSSRVLNFPDLTVDGSFPLGAAVTAALITQGWAPWMATLMALGAGLLAGASTGLLNTKLRISGMLAGILTMTGLYSVNLRVMGRSNLPLLRQPTILTRLADYIGSDLRVALFAFIVISLAVKLFLDWFLHTELGLAVRATGDNPQMIRSQGVDTDAVKVLGLSMANAMVALSGSLVAQHQGFADVGMGIGTIVTGLASVIIGEVLFRPRTVFWATTSVLFGSVVYRIAVFLALRMGFAPTDLKIVTAALVILALSAPVLQESLALPFVQGIRSLAGKREAVSTSVKDGRPL
jgi:putative ABC transport system permease protein